MHKHSKLTSYILGFIFSLGLTLGAYMMVDAHIHSHHQVISHELLIPALVGLALVQLVVQLFFFLHLGEESGPRWKLAVFVSTIGLVLIVVLGSLWIMDHLNYNMTPAQMNQYIETHQGGF